jgi:hypothetical protein
MRSDIGSPNRPDQVTLDGTVGAAFGGFGLRVAGGGSDGIGIGGLP